MVLTVIEGKGPIETPSASWEVIERALSRLEPAQRPAVIITDAHSGSYIQCAGSTDRLTVESRNVHGADFKHFVYGSAAKEQEENNVLKTEIITCSVGPIVVQTSEVLTIADATTLFRSFFDRAEVPKGYRTRNTTQVFTEGGAE